MLNLSWHDRVQHVELNRPERRNALDYETLQELLAAQAEARERSARVVVLSGAPPAFCAGADLSGVEDTVFVEALRATLQGFGALDCPVIAAIDGPALGAGTQLAVACDLRVATESSPLGIPAANLGIAVDQWTVERMAREIGWAITRDMLVAASRYSAESLYRSGFVHRLGTVDDALAWAAQLATLAPLTIAAHKRTLEVLAPPSPVLAAAELARLQAWASQDAAEGVKAFAEKRAPKFEGR